VSKKVKVYRHIKELMTEAVHLGMDIPTNDRVTYDDIREYVTEQHQSHAEYLGDFGSCWGYPCRVIRAVERLDSDFSVSALNVRPDA
jgi:hypothetical protein